MFLVMRPWIQANPKVQRPIHPGGSQGHRLVPHIQWVPFGAGHLMPGHLTQSVAKHSVAWSTIIWEHISNDSHPRYCVLFVQVSYV